MSADLIGPPGNWVLPSFFSCSPVSPISFSEVPGRQGRSSVAEQRDILGRHGHAVGLSCDGEGVHRRGDEAVAAGAWLIGNQPSCQRTPPAQSFAPSRMSALAWGACWTNWSFMPSKLTCWTAASAPVLVAPGLRGSPIGPARFSSAQMVRALPDSASSPEPPSSLPQAASAKPV